MKPLPHILHLYFLPSSGPCLVLICFPNLGQSFCTTHGFSVLDGLFSDVVKLRQGSGKDGQGMARKAKGLKAPLPRAYIKVGCHHHPPPPPPKSLILLN